MLHPFAVVKSLFGAKTQRDERLANRVGNPKRPQAYLQAYLKAKFAINSHLRRLPAALCGAKRWDSIDHLGNRYELKALASKFRRLTLGPLLHLRPLVLSGCNYRLYGHSGGTRALVTFSAGTSEKLREHKKSMTMLSNFTWCIAVLDMRCSGVFFQVKFWHVWPQLLQVPGMEMRFVMEALSDCSSRAHRVEQCRGEDCSSLNRVLQFFPNALESRMRGLGMCM